MKFRSYLHKNSKLMNEITKIEPNYVANVTFSWMIKKKIALFKETWRKPKIAQILRLLSKLKWT